MEIVEIGVRLDGSLLGEDESGSLYSGVVTPVTFSQLTRTVTSQSNGVTTYKDTYNGVVVGGGEVADHIYDGLLNDVAGHTTDVTVWTALL